MYNAAQEAHHQAERHAETVCDIERLKRELASAKRRKKDTAWLRRFWTRIDRAERVNAFLGFNLV